MSSLHLRRLLFAVLVTAGACSESDRGTADGAEQRIDARIAPDVYSDADAALDAARDAGASGGMTGAGGASGGGGASGVGGASGSGGAAGTGGGPAPSKSFARGINLSYRNTAWSDAERADLAALAGCNGVRVKLPEYHLAEWGTDAEVSDVQHYAALGMTNLVGFLIGPTREHSTMPSGRQDWELDHWMPQNLYQPIFTSGGGVNPANYWAAYVERAVTTYGRWIKIWEIWNEPDWIPDYMTAAKWSSQPPIASELPRWNGSVFDYVRMLRISYEVARKVDPAAQIAVGGLGYASFLSAVARYTDNPADGSVAESYPRKGGDWFDIIDFHYYPIYTAGNSDAGVKGFLQQKTQFASTLSELGIAGKGWLVTETGAPRQVLSSYPGGVEYARNYAIKVMVYAQASDLLGVHWFQLSDAGTSSDPYDYMGLYFDIQSLATPANAARTDTGEALRTTAKLLNGAELDATATTALALPASVCGGAFRRPDGPRVSVLWACSTATGETATATFALPAASAVVLHAWDHAKTGVTQTLTPSNGKVSLALTSSPVFVVGD